MAEAKRYRSTPRGTFPTSSPLSSQAPLGYSEILRTLGPYSAGPMAERAARDAVAERDAAMASGRGATLRDAILGQTLNSPTGANRMRAAAMGASPMELAKLMPQRGGMDPQTAAGMQGVTQSARGIRGATMGSINGKQVMLPAAGAKNREAFQSDVSDLKLNPMGPVSPDAVTWKQYKKTAAQQAAKLAEEERAQKRALDLKKQEGDNAARAAEITAKGAVDAAGAKGSGGQLKDTEATRKQLGAARAQFGKEFDDKVERTRGDVSIWASANNKEEGGPEYRRELQRRINENGLRDRNDYIARRARAEFSGALGVTPGFEYRQSTANEVFPGLFDLGRAGLTPPTQLPQNAPPQAPMRGNGGPPPSASPVEQIRGAVGSLFSRPAQDAAPPAAPPMPTPAESQQVNRILRQQEQQQVVGDSIEAGMGAQQNAMAGMDAQRGASALEAATSPEAFRAVGEDPPFSQQEIAALQSSAEAAQVISGMQSAMAKLPPNSMLALAMQQSIEATAQKGEQLRRAGL